MAMNRDNPHFTEEELRAIYAAAEEKSHAGILAAAAALYPDRTEERQTLYWLPKGGRAFRLNGVYCKPVNTLQSWPVELAVMEDGTLLPY